MSTLISPTNIKITDDATNGWMTIGLSVGLPVGVVVIALVIIIIICMIRKKRKEKKLEQSKPNEAATNNESVYLINKGIGLLLNTSICY